MIHAIIYISLIMVSGMHAAACNQTSTITKINTFARRFSRVVGGDSTYIQPSTIADYCEHEARLNRVSVDDLLGTPELSDQQYLRFVLSNAKNRNVTYAMLNAVPPIFKNIHACSFKKAGEGIDFLTKLYDSYNSIYSFPFETCRLILAVIGLREIVRNSSEVSLQEATRQHHFAFDFASCPTPLATRTKRILSRNWAPANHYGSDETLKMYEGTKKDLDLKYSDIITIALPEAEAQKVCDAHKVMADRVQNINDFLARNAQTAIRLCCMQHTNQFINVTTETTYIESVFRPLKMVTPTITSFVMSLHARMLPTKESVKSETDDDITEFNYEDFISVNGDDLIKLDNDSERTNPASPTFSDDDITAPRLTVNLQASNSLSSILTDDYMPDSLKSPDATDH